MALTRYELESLSYLECERKGIYSICQLSDTLCISGSIIMKCLDDLKAETLISEGNDVFSITKNG